MFGLWKVLEMKDYLHIGAVLNMYLTTQPMRRYSHIPPGTPAVYPLWIIEIQIPALVLYPKLHTMIVSLEAHVLQLFPIKNNNNNNNNIRNNNFFQF